MEIFCTYCSKEKDELINSLPAIHRYRSKRIRKINEAAKLLGFPMFILSGKYGLIPTEAKIPHYDHLLLDDEVSSLVIKKIEPRLREYDITKIFFFRNTTDPYIKPYIDAITQACKLTKVEIIFLEVDIGEIENVSSNGYREIWHSSLRSNQSMVNNRDINASAFSKLIKRYPYDGMIYYERAEAYECLGELEKAKNDYEQALLYFPNPKWKRVAYEGLKRIQNSIGSPSKRVDLDEYWNDFHKINSYTNIPHEIRVFVLSSLERFKEEKRLAIGELRICLEMVVLKLSKKFKTRGHGFFKDIDFTGKIKDLKEAGCNDLELNKIFKECWFTMGEIIHPIKYSKISDKKFEEALNLFIRILEICNSKMLFGKI